MIYACNKTNQMYMILISQIYFWNRTLHVSDRSSAHHQESTTVYTAIGIWHTEIYIPSAHIYRVSQEECARLRESVPYVKLYQYNPKHLYPKLNGYEDNGQRSLKL